MISVHVITEILSKSPQTDNTLPQYLHALVLRGYGFFVRGSLPGLCFKKYSGPYFLITLFSLDEKKKKAGIGKEGEMTLSGNSTGTVLLAQNFSHSMA